jgi:hypothetical protein
MTKVRASPDRGCVGFCGEEVYFVLQGRGYIEAEGERYESEAGDAIYNRENTAHRVFNTGTEPVRLCVVGKPIFEARVEVRRAAEIFEYYAAWAWQPRGFLLASARPATELRARRVSLGVVALLTPGVMSSMARRLP